MEAVLSMALVILPFRFSFHLLVNPNSPLCVVVIVTELLLIVLIFLSHILLDLLYWLILATGKWGADMLIWP
jgi:hypothetical protein